MHRLLNLLFSSHFITKFEITYFTCVSHTKSGLTLNIKVCYCTCALSFSHLHRLALPAQTSFLSPGQAPSLRPSLLLHPPLPVSVASAFSSPYACLLWSLQDQILQVHQPNPITATSSPTWSQHDQNINEHTTSTHMYLYIEH